MKVGQQVTDSTVLCHIEVCILSTTNTLISTLLSPFSGPCFPLKYTELAAQNCDPWAGRIVVAVPIYDYLEEIYHVK